MAGCVIQAWFAPEAQLRDWPFEFIETDFPDFAAACVAINTGGLIGGQRLITKASPDRGERLVVGRKPFAFRATGVIRIELPSVRLVEEV